jgi:competence protein ComEA
LQLFKGGSPDSYQNKTGVEMLKKIIAGLLLFATVTFGMSLTKLNSASKADLMEINGIGEVIAGDLIKERRKGKFKSFADLQERVNGIGEQKIANIKGDVKNAEDVKKVVKKKSTKAKTKAGAKKKMTKKKKTTKTKAKEKKEKSTAKTKKKTTKAKTKADDKKKKTKKKSTKAKADKSKKKTSKAKSADEKKKTLKKKPRKTKTKKTKLKKKKIKKIKVKKKN